MPSTSTQLIKDWHTYNSDEIHWKCAAIAKLPLQVQPYFFGSHSYAFLFEVIGWAYFRAINDPVQQLVSKEGVAYLHIIWYSPLQMTPNVYVNYNEPQLTYETVRFTSSGFTLTFTSTMSSVMLAGAEVYIKVYVK